MAQKIYTFSVSDRQPEVQEFLARVKKDCASHGQTFSWVVLQALRQYKGDKDE